MEKIKKIILALAAVCFISAYAFAQEDISEAEAKLDEATVNLVNDAIEKLKNNDYNGAIEILEPIRKDIKEVDTAVFCLAESYYFSKRYEDAEKTYQHLLTLETSESRRESSITALGNIYMSAGRYDEAAEVLQKLIELKGSDVNLLYRIASIYKKGENDEKMLEYLDKALSEDPTFKRALEAKAAHYQESGNLDKAKDILKAAADENPDNAEIQDLHKNFVISVNLEAGNKLIESKDYSAAIPHLKEIVEVDPSAVSVSFKLANCYFNTGNYPETIRILKDLEDKKDVKSDSENVFSLYKLYALTFYNAGLYKRAVDAGKNAYAYKPDDFELNKYLGKSYENTFKPEKALEHYSNAIEIKPDDFIVYHWAALLHVNEGAYEKAMNILGDAIEKGYSAANAKADYNNIVIAFYMNKASALYKEASGLGKSNETYNSKLNEALSYYDSALSVERRPVILAAKANTLILLENYSEAEPLLKEALEIDKGMPDVYISLARLYEMSSQPDKRADVLADLEKLENADDPDLAYSLALNYSRSKDEKELKKAIELFEKLLSEPGYESKAKENIAISYYNLGAKKLNEKLFDAAKTYFDKSLEYKPDFQDAKLAQSRAQRMKKRGRLKEMIDQADSYFDSGKFAEAASLYEEIIEVNPDLRNVKLSLAAVYMNSRVGKYVEAVSLLKPMYEADTGDKEVIMMMGNAYNRLGDMQKAKSYFERAIEADHDAHEARVMLASVLQKEKDYDKAVAQYKLAKKLASSNALSYHKANIKLGNLYYVMDDFDKALAEYEEVLKKDPTNPLANYNTAIIYYKKNKLDKALEYINKASTLEKYPSYKLSKAKIFFYKEDYAKAKELSAKAYQQMASQPAEKNIIYKWWNAKSLSKLAAKGAADKQSALSLLDECIDNKADRRVAYYARMEKLNIEGKDMASFENYVDVNVDVKPLLVDDRQYMMSKYNSIVCQDFETEINEWEELEDFPVSGKFVAGEYLFYGLQNSTLVARELDDGEEKWRINTETILDNYCADGDTLVASANGKLIAYKDGKTLWSTPFESESKVKLCAGDGAVFAFADEKLSAINTKNGEKQFSIEPEKGYEMIDAASYEDGAIVFYERRGDTYISAYGNDGSLINKTEAPVEGVLSSAVAPVISGNSLLFYTDKEMLASVLLSSMGVMWTGEAAALDSISLSEGKVYASSGMKVLVYSAVSGKKSAEFNAQIGDNTFVTIYTRK